ISASSNPSRFVMSTESSHQPQSLPQANYVQTAGFNEPFADFRLAIGTYAVFNDNDRAERS
ncbi:MAG: hypothetical protein P8M80_02505, partial [Pirellulaceae bacterium]|nr:hypothetical protein [Pirellulaceae bacterium]